MVKRESESFKEYAQRWRDLAAQVAPPMVEREMVTMMVDTLPVFYDEKLVGYMPSSFADLVFTGERIEVGLKRGKFDYISLKERNNWGKEERRRCPYSHFDTCMAQATANPPRYPPICATSPEFFGLHRGLF